MHVANIFLLGIWDASNFLSDLRFNFKEKEKKNIFLTNKRKINNYKSIKKSVF